MVYETHCASGRVHGNVQTPYRVLEYARNVLGFKEAQHAEYDPYSSDLFISQLTCSLAGREMQLALMPGSRISKIYGALNVTEEYYSNLGVNPSQVALLRSGELRITGSDLEGEIRVIELPDHPFFIGTLFVPQVKSTVDCPHPLVSTFLSVASEQGNQVRSSSAVSVIRRCLDAE